jgi:hypothetical protein
VQLAVECPTGAWRQLSNVNTLSSDLFFQKIEKSFQFGAWWQNDLRVRSAYLADCNFRFCGAKIMRTVSFQIAKAMFRANAG